MAEVGSCLKVATGYNDRRVSRANRSAWRHAVSPDACRFFISIGRSHKGHPNVPLYCYRSVDKDRGQV